MRLLAWVWNGARIVHASLGVKREVIVLLILALPFLFHEYVRDFMAARGVRDWPVVDGTMAAVLVAGMYLYWRLLRHAVIFEYLARPRLAMRILDPGQRYDTFVALGNRMVRLYHLEVINASMYKTAHGVAVTLVEYQKAGDSKVVDIRSRLKVANSDAEEVDLNPGARVVFELCGVDANGAEPASQDKRDHQTFSILPVGSGMLRIFAEARDAPAREEQLRVYIDSTGAMTIKPHSAAA